MRKIFVFICLCHVVAFLLQLKGTLYPSDTPVKTELILSYIHVCFIFFQTQWKTCHNNKPLFHPGSWKITLWLKWHHSATTPSQQLCWEIRVRQWQQGCECHSAMNPTLSISKWLFHCQDIQKVKLRQLPRLRPLITQHPLSLKLTTLAKTGQEGEQGRARFRQPVPPAEGRAPVPGPRRFPGNGSAFHQLIFF